MGDYDTEPRSSAAPSDMTSRNAPEPKTNGDTEGRADRTLKPADQKAREGYEKSFRKGWGEVREDTAPPKADDPFGGGHGTKRSVYGKQVGEGGFGERLIGGSAAVAQLHSEGWNMLAAPAKPVPEPLDTGLKLQADFIRRDQADKGGFGADPAWVQVEKAYSNQWATENMESIHRYKFEQWRWVSAYNDWTPLANQSHVAMAEVVETASLMGFDTSKDKDSAAFILGLERSLDMAIQLADAKVLGDKGDQSLSTRNDDPTAVSRTTPQLGGTAISPALGGITAAYREVQLAHHGIYKGLLEDQKAALDAEGGEVTEQIEKINAVIEFWAGMGEFAQGAAGAVKTVEKVHAKVQKHVQNGDHHAKKELNAAKKRAHDGEKDPSDYQADIDAHAHGDNYEEHYDTWGKGGEEKVKEGKEARQHGDIEVAGAGHAAEAIEIPEPPPELSVGGLIKAGLTALNKKKLTELNERLATITQQTKATTHAIQMVQSRAAAAHLAAASATLEGEMAKLGTQSMRGREQDVMAMGHDLDSYAVEHHAALHKQRADGLVPTAGHEIYATAMACVAKIEKYRAVSKLALGTFSYNEFIGTATHVARERANQIRPDESAGRDPEKTGHPPPALPHMTEQEQELFQQIGGTYTRALQFDAQWSVRLEGIVARFHALMKKLSGSGGNPSAVGRTF